MGAAGAAVAVFGGQTRETGDGVEVGLMVAHLGEGAERGQRRQHWKPVREEEQERISYTFFVLYDCLNVWPCF